jgi:hypothetical protein
MVLFVGDFALIMVSSWNCFLTDLDFHVNNKAHWSGVVVLVKSLQEWLYQGYKLQPTFKSVRLVTNLP